MPALRLPALIVLSTKPYRNHRLELRDAGGSDCRVVIHPPQGRCEPQEIVEQDGQLLGLSSLIAQAKAMIDSVLSPRPPAAVRTYAGRPAG